MVILISCNHVLQTMCVHENDAQLQQLKVNAALPTSLPAFHYFEHTPHKQLVSEMGTDDITENIKALKRKLTFYEGVLRERACPICAQKFVERPVNGLRVNGEFQYVCTEGGRTY